VIATTNKSLSALHLGVCYGVRMNTARLFMYKGREAMKAKIYIITKLIL